MDNQKKENQDQKKEKDKVNEILNPTGGADSDNPANDPKEGGIRRGENGPAKGGRHGNASIEDGGNTEGSSAGSR